MAFALLIAGVVMLVAAMRNTQLCLVRIVQSDFTGTNNFTYWIVALIVIGAIGYVEKLKKISDGLLVLIFVALFLSRGQGPGGGFFGKFVTALQGTVTAPSPIPQTSGFLAGYGNYTIQNFDAQGRLIIGGSSGIPNPYGSPPVSPLPPGPIGVGRGVGIAFGGG